MSRNKVVLLVATLAIIYLLLPNHGTTGLIRAYMLALLPYILIFLIVWLFVTINLLRRALIRLSKDLSNRNTLAVAKLLSMTFDVKRFIGEQNLINMYKGVNFSKDISIQTKTALYNSISRKRIHIPPPSQGKSQHLNKSYSPHLSKNKKRNKK